MCRAPTKAAAGVSHKPGAEKEALNPVIQSWSNIYRAIPKIYVPFTKFNVSFTLVTFVVLLGLRLAGSKLFEEYFGWPADSKMKKDAAAGLASIIHALFLVPSCGILLWSSKYSPRARLDSMPIWWQDVATLLLEMCTGYMLFDAFGMCMDEWKPGKGPVLTSGDMVFIAHHFATSVYMTSCRAVGAGHMSALILMFTGEFTNPFQNLHIITRYGIKLAPTADSFWHVVHPYVEYTFMAFYAFFRAFVGPACIVHLTYDLLFTKQGRKNVPIYISLFLWMPMAWGVILGSWPWTMESINIVTGGFGNVKYDVNFDYGPRYEL